MTAAALLSEVCRALDERRWGDLPAMLSAEFVCRYVHTGERFDRDSWVRLNADYPGFERLVIEDLVDGGDRAAARCHVTATGAGGLAHFEVATFVRAEGEVIVEMVEVWTDVDQEVPDGGRGSTTPRRADVTDVS